MVRENVGLRRAAVELSLDLTQEECDKISKRKNFQDILRAERNKYYGEIATTPGHSKNSAVGLMVFLINKLIEDGQYDKALEGVQKLSKLEGWDKSEQVNIIAGISSRDLEEARKTLLERLSQQDPRPSLDN